MKVRIGESELELGGRYLGELRDANDLLGDREALLARMAEDGYLLIRDLHPRARVLDAQRAVLAYVAQHSDAIRTDRDVIEGRINPEGRLPRTLGNRQITHAPPVRQVLEGKPIFEFFEQFFNEPARTFDYKWLRVVGADGFTGAHYDVVYMGQGSTRLLTCWVPLGDIPIEQGTLCLCVGSHHRDGFEKLHRTYGRMDVDRDRIEGTFSHNPIEIIERFGGRWHTTNFRAGDVLIFTMFTMHGSTNNTTDRWRISCDTRFQPAADPVDKRWVGESPIAHDAQTQKPGNIMDIKEARAKWGV